MGFANDTASCFNFFSDRTQISRSVAFTVSFLCVSVMLMGGASNLKIIMIFCMNSKFIGKVTSLITFLLALSDISITFIVMPLVLTLFLKLEEINCDKELTAQFLWNFFSRLSGYYVFLVGFDRLLRAAYLMNYKEKVTNKVIFGMISLAVAASMVSAASLTAVSSNWSQYFLYAVLLVNYLDFQLFVAVVGTYFKVYVGFYMRRMTETQRNYSNFSTRLSCSVLFVLMSSLQKAFSSEGIFMN